ncbi:MAG: penicillin-binding protein 1A [Alphaproteobacteria bacterium]|nr:penicillin-binding protein 1A [Alphaproteobacteria bacterium]
MKFLLKFFLKLLSAILILGVLGATSVIGLFWYFGKDLPDYNQLEKYDPPVITRMHAGDGTLFAEYAHEKRIFIPINAIPKKVVQTFLVVEDKNFFDHPGLDWTGIFRAAFVNGISYLQGGGKTIGGSTITQQVAKNFLLTNERTLTRKVKEAILSLRIERTFSKEKILELYLNEIYLGNGTYGIASAALHYFNKSLDELSDAECAYIAGLPKAPSTYNPKKNYKAALKRRDWVIHRMFEEKILTQEEALKAINTPIELKLRKTNVVDTNYFAEHIRQEVIKLYGEQQFYQGGLSVRTTLNSRLQKLADKSLRNGLIRYDRNFGWRGPLQKISLEDWSKSLEDLVPPPGINPWILAVVLEVSKDRAQIGFKEGKTGIIPLNQVRWAKKHLVNPESGYPYTGPAVQGVDDVLNPGDVIVVSPLSDTKDAYALEQIPEINGALVALDPHTGRVLALNGGYRFHHSQFNRAIQAQRQLGSAFKPIVYLAALEKGYTPASLILDAPLVIDIGHGTIWKPQNITKKFYGSVTLREALENSYNLAMIRVAQEIGMGVVASISKKLGLYDNLSYELANVLGAQSTTLLKLVTAYAAIVNGGQKVTPIMIDRIQDRQGKNIYQSSTKTCDDCSNQPWKGQEPPTLQDTRQQILNPIHAYQMVSMLEGCVARGTAKNAAIPGYSIGGKTGTSNKYMDTWFIGFSPDLVVGIIVGFDQPKSLGKWQTGATVAAPIFKEFMEKALKGKPPVPFRIPSGVKFMPVNQKTGKASTHKDKNSIMEVFEEGALENDSKEPFSGLLLEETNGIY